MLVLTHLMNHDYERLVFHRECLQHGSNDAQNADNQLAQLCPAEALKFCMQNNRTSTIRETHGVSCAICATEPLAMTGALILKSLDVVLPFPKQNGSSVLFERLFGALYAVLQAVSGGIVRPFKCNVPLYWGMGQNLGPLTVSCRVWWP